MADSWEYRTISTNSADLTTSLAKFNISRELADQLRDDSIIGNDVRDRAYVAGPDVTERMRVRPLIDAMKERIKLKKERYYQFRSAVLKVLGPDAEVVEPYLPTRPEHSEVQTKCSGMQDSMGQLQGSTNSDISMFPRQQKNPSRKRQSHSTTAITPYKDCCCCLIRDGSLQDTGSGVIVKLTSKPACLPGLNPSVDEYGSLQTSYVLITCHHIIPGMSDLKGWDLDLGLGKTYKLESLVRGAASCCGKEGIISSGTDPEGYQEKIFLPHQNGACYLELDFTMLFLNKKFEKKISSQIAVPELSLDIPKPQEQEPKLLSDTQPELQLYQRVPAGQERTIVLELDLLQLKVQQDMGTHSSPPQRLRDEIEMNKMFQRIHYTCTPEHDCKIKEGSLGSPVVYYDPVNDKAHLVGIHVGGAHNTGYYGVTMYEIMQLLKGEPAAFFAIMELPLARRMWPVRWAHLLIHTLTGYGPQNRPSYSYLVGVLHLLLHELEGIRLINLRIADSSKLIVEPALKLLAALFKCFEDSGNEEIEAAISGDGGVFAGDKKAEEEFRTALKKLSEFLVAYQKSKILSENICLVNTYLKCHNMMLNFKEKDIVALLCKDGVIARLKSLREKYPSLEIERNFSDILAKSYHVKKEEYESQLQKQRQELQEQHESQLALALQKQRQELQEQHESQLALALQKQRQELQEQYEPQLQKHVQRQNLQEEYESQLQQLQLQKAQQKAQIRQRHTQRMKEIELHEQCETQTLTATVRPGTAADQLGN